MADALPARSIVQQDDPPKRPRGRPRKVQVTEGPPVASSGCSRRIRLRSTAHPLPVTLDCENGQTVSYTLRPGRWETVPDRVYQMLKSKFGKPKTRVVPDWNPGGEGQMPERTPRVEEYEAYVIEGLED